MIENIKDRHRRIITGNYFVSAVIARILDNFGLYLKCGQYLPDKENIGYLVNILDFENKLKNISKRLYLTFIFNIETGCIRALILVDNRSISEFFCSVNHDYVTDEIIHHFTENFINNFISIFKEMEKEDPKDISSADVTEESIKELGESSVKENTENSQTWFFREIKSVRILEVGYTNENLMIKVLFTFENDDKFVVVSPAINLPIKENTNIPILDESRIVGHYLHYTSNLWLIVEKTSIN